MKIFNSAIILAAIGFATFATSGCGGAQNNSTAAAAAAAAPVGCPAGTNAVNVPNYGTVCQSTMGYCPTGMQPIYNVPGIPLACQGSVTNGACPTGTTPLNNTYGQTSCQPACPNNGTWNQYAGNCNVAMPTNNSYYQTPQFQPFNCFHVTVWSSYSGWTDRLACYYTYNAPTPGWYFNGWTWVPMF